MNFEKGYQRHDSKQCHVRVPLITFGMLAVMQQIDVHVIFYEQKLSLFKESLISKTPMSHATSDAYMRAPTRKAPPQSRHLWAGGGRLCVLLQHVVEHVVRLQARRQRALVRIRVVADQAPQLRLLSAIGSGVKAQLQGAVSQAALPS